eukprot:1485971-Rhodomonas_salina.1
MPGVYSFVIVTMLPGYPRGVRQALEDFEIARARNRTRAVSASRHTVSWSRIVPRCKYKTHKVYAYAVWPMDTEFLPGYKGGQLKYRYLYPGTVPGYPGTGTRGPGLDTNNTSINITSNSDTTRVTDLKKVERLRIVPNTRVPKSSPQIRKILRQSATCHQWHHGAKVPGYQVPGYPLPGYRYPTGIPVHE